MEVSSDESQCCTGLLCCVVDMVGPFQIVRYQEAKVGVVLNFLEGSVFQLVEVR